MKSNLGHYGLAKWIRFSEQQAKVALKRASIVVYTFAEVQCIWIGG